MSSDVLSPIAAPATRSAVLMHLAIAEAAGLPGPHSITRTGPTEAGGNATLWLGHGDTTGVQAWVEWLEEAGGRTIHRPTLDAREYPVTGGRGTYRIYRSAVVLDGWRISINCQVTS